MYAALLADARFHDLLLAADRDLAETCRTEGCPCGGPRHMARYDRKPRGRPCRLGPEHDQRFSFCCAVDGCRSRATPPSLRFLGRRVYLGVVVIVASLVAQALGTAETSRPVTGVPARTTKRWLGWWRGPFLSTAVLVAVQARLVGVDTQALPASIVAKLPGTWQQRVRVVLEFLTPLTTGSLPAGSPFLRVTA